MTGEALPPLPPLTARRCCTNIPESKASEVCTKLKAPTIVHRGGDSEEYKKLRYELRRAISSAKRQYKEKVESDFKGCNTQNMWAGLRTMTDYKGAAGGAAGVSACASLPDELNSFFARFESSQAVEAQRDQELEPFCFKQGRCVQIL